MNIKEYSGESYNVTTLRNPKGYYYIYVPDYTWHINFKYDLMVIYGGSRLYINKDGSRVMGRETFTQSDLKNVYKYFVENLSPKVISMFSNPTGEKSA